MLLCIGCLCVYGFQLGDHIFVGQRDAVANQDTYRTYNHKDIHQSTGQRVKDWRNYLSTGQTGNGTGELAKPRRQHE